MLRNYFITALRNILRNKIQSLIQVLSLAIGITAAIMIGLYVKHEFSYDRFHEKLDRIYRVEFGAQVGLWSAIGHQIKQEIPEVENVARVLNWHGKDWCMTLEYIPSNDSANKRIADVYNVYWCDSSVFDLFTIPLIQGDRITALKDPNSCVISKNTAKKLFGDEDPIGESFGEEGLWTITGVFEDLMNSHLDINLFISIVTLQKNGGVERGHPRYLNNYADQAHITYVLLPEGADPSFVEKRIDDFFQDKWKTTFEYEAENSFHLRPLKEIYFSNNLENEMNTFNHGNRGLLRVLSSVAIFILVLGIINYMNLTTARASLRAREVGIRKVVGSTKPGLIRQFLVEATVVTLLSFLIALTLVHLLLPGFNQLASTELDMQIWNMPGTWIPILLLVILLGILSGIYPAVYLTGFQPMASISGSQFKGKGSVYFRRILLTFQFTISMILIIGVLVISSQLNHMKTTELGYNNELIVHLPENNLWGPDHLKRQLIREKLLNNPNVRGVTFSHGISGEEQNIVAEPGTLKGIKKYTAWQGIDPEYIDLMEIQIVKGRNFSRNRPADYWPDRGNQTGRIMVNETFLREFELEFPADHFITYENGFQQEIIGVVNDFHYTSLHEKIQPTSFFWMEYLSYLSIKITPQNIESTLKFIQSELESIFPEKFEYTLQYSFLDETYARQYIRDEKTARIIINFAIVAVLIACLGLFGLSSFMAARRIKEIGIRKAFGASVQSVFLLLAREFIKWVGLAIVIACPVAWIIMDRWLQSFAYRTNISWWIFAVAILTALVITFATVTWQSLKTARTNPIESLRYE